MLLLVRECGICGWQTTGDDATVYRHITDTHGRLLKHTREFARYE